MQALQIIGRRSSHFTRLTLFVAEELGVPYDLVPIHDMTALGADAYGANPALKLPTLRRGDELLFGALNICRAIAEGVEATNVVVWPEQVRDDVSRNAQELVWHGMAAQVQLIVGTAIGKLPADNVFFAKARAGLEGSMQWLDAHLAQAIERLPVDRTLSVFEVSLFCLCEHLVWRGTMALHQHPALDDFVAAYGARPAAQRTAYAFDKPSA